MLRAAPLAKPAAPIRGSLRVARSVQAAATPTGLTVSDLKAKNGKAVVEIGGSKVLLALDGTEVRAVSNKCTHLGLPLVGKTAFLQGEVAGGCVTCSAHGSRFNLTTGAPEGDWCPKMPNLPIVGKGPGPKPLPTYKVTVAEDGAISVDA